MAADTEWRSVQMESTSRQATPMARCRYGVLPTERRITRKGHTSSITLVTYSPDGTRIATASLDHTVKMWMPFRTWKR